MQVLIHNQVTAHGTQRAESDVDMGGIACRVVLKN